MARYGGFVDAAEHTQLFTGAIPGSSDNSLETKIFDGDDLDANSTYILAVSAQCSTDNNTYWTNISLNIGDTSVGLGSVNPNYGFERSNVEWKNYFLVGTILTDSSPSNGYIRLQPYADNNSTGVCNGKIDSIVAWWVKVDAISDSWAQDTYSEEALTSSFIDRQTVTVEATATNNRWLVMDSSELDWPSGVDSTTNYAEARINRDTDTETTPGYVYSVARNEGVGISLATGAAIGMFRTYDLSPGTHTFTVQHKQSEASPDANIRLRKGSLVAICLSALFTSDHDTVYTEARVEKSYSLTDIQEIAAYTPATTFDHVIMGYASYPLDNGPTDTFNYRLRLDDTTELPTGHFSQEYYGRNSSVIFPMPIMAFTTLTGATAYEIDLEVDPDDAGSAFQNRSLVVFTLDESPIKTGQAALTGAAQTSSDLFRVAPSDQGILEKTARATIYAVVNIIRASAGVTASAVMDAEATHILWSNVVLMDADLISRGQTAGQLTFLPAIYTIDRAGADMKCQVLLPNVAEGGFLLVFRYVDYSNYWAVRVYEDRGQYLLEKTVAGVKSTIADLGLSLDGDLLEALTIGDLIQVGINGEWYSYEDTDLNTATKCGIGLESSNALVRVERFQAWDLTARAPNPAVDPGHTFYGAPETWA